MFAIFWHTCCQYFQLGFSSKIEVPQLGSAQNLHSSGSLELENSSSNSSLPIRVMGINSPWIWWRSWRSGWLQMWIFILCNRSCPIFVSTYSWFRFRRFWGGWWTTTFCRPSWLFLGCLLIYLATNTFPRPLNKKFVQNQKRKF